MTLDLAPFKKFATRHAAIPAPLLALCLAPAIACVPDPSAMTTDAPATTDATTTTTGSEPPTTGASTTGDETTSEPTSTSTTTGGGVCGDGELDDDELCDDGNNDDGDACSADCSAATCLVPVTHPTIQAGVDDPACPIVWLAPGEYHESVVIARDVELVAVDWARISGMQRGRPLEIAARTTVALRGLLVTDGLAERGAGILSHGALELDRSHVLHNKATGAAPCGGGVWSDGVVVLRASTVEENDSWVFGAEGVTARGAGLCMQGGRLELREASSVADNLARGKGSGPYVVEGGGIAATDTVIEIVEGSRVDSNIAAVEDAKQASTARGGAIHLTGGALTLVDAVLFDNRARIDAPDADDVTMIAEGGGVALLGGTLDASRVTLEGQKASVIGGRGNARGGGLLARSDATLALRECTLYRNDASSYSKDLMMAEHVSRGGAIDLEAGAGETLTLTLEDSLVRDNDTDAHASPPATLGSAGAGLFATATGAGATLELAVRRSTFVDNRASAYFDVDGFLPPGSVGLGEGGAVALRGEPGGTIALALVDATLAGNSAYGESVEVKLGTGSGGALAATAAEGSSVAVQLRSATIAANDADPHRGAGLWLPPGGAPVLVAAANTVLLDNSGDDCDPAEATLTSLGHNALGSLTCALDAPDMTDIFPAEAMLHLLADNGGPTPTCGFAPNSPLRDAGDPAGCTDVDGSPLATDQRGEERHAGDACDIGAFEHQP